MKALGIALALLALCVLGGLIVILFINTYSVGTPVPEVAPSSQPVPAFLLPLMDILKNLEALL